MTMHREVSCNICRWRTAADSRAIEGIHFIGTGTESWRARAAECETHICHDCLRLAKALCEALEKDGHLTETTKGAWKGPA